jgi:hypothetical protein
MTIRWGQVYGDRNNVRFAATCDSCGRLSVGQAASLPNNYNVGTDLGSVSQAAGQAETMGKLEWWPKVGTAPVVDDVPDAIARAAREAYSSASVGNHMAAILMARTVVEATAKANGILTGTLAAKIDAMRDKQLIRPAIAEQAHEVRFAGNDMAHGDIEAAVDATDSEELLALMAEVLSEAFQGPARLERIRQKRQAWKET